MKVKRERCFHTAGGGCLKQSARADDRGRYDRNDKKLLGQQMDIQSIEGYGPCVGR